MSKQTFVANTILTAAQLNTLQANDYNQTVSTKTASYTLVASDAGTRVVMNVASANTVTVNTSLFSAGDTLVIQNIGAGVTTVTAGTATVSSAGPLTISQYGSGTLYFTSAGVSLWFPSAGPTASSGLTFIAGGSLSGSSTTFTNAFSATYDNYKIFIANIASSTGTSQRFKLGSANTNYEYSSMYAQNTVTWTNRGYDATIFDFADSSTSVNFSVAIEVMNPFLSATTYFSAIGAGQDTARYMTVGIQRSSTSFTDFTYSPLSGTQTGTVKIYGYANS